MPVTRADPALLRRDTDGTLRRVASARTRSRLHVAAMVGILTALLAGCGLGTTDTSGEDGMDHAEADRRTRDLVRGPGNSGCHDADQAG